MLSVHKYHCTIMTPPLLPDLSCKLNLDLTVGYSSEIEDLHSIDTEYVGVESLPDLNEKEVNILHINIRGLLNKQDGLIRLLTQMGGKNKVSVVSLNETWLRKETVNKIDIPGYKFVGNCRQGKKGGGVGLLISNCLRFREVNDLLPVLPTLEFHCIEIMTKTKPLLVITVYQVPNQSLPDSTSDFTKLFKLTNNPKYDTIVCSDHNLDLLKTNSHQRTQDFLESITSNNFYPTITKPTRLTHTSASLIDNIFVNKRELGEYKSWLIAEDLSDHLPCLLNLPRLDADRSGPNQIWRRKLNEKTLSKIEQSFQNIDWNHELDVLNCEDSFNLFHDKLTQCIERFAPERPVPIKDKASNQPWVMRGLKKCITKQKALYKQQLSDHSAITEYKRYKSCLQKILRNSKRAYLCGLCVKHKNNTKKLWGIINDILKKEQNKNKYYIMFRNKSDQDI